MNSKYEVCRNCKAQCFIENEAVKLTKRFTNQEIDSSQLTSGISTLSGRGKREFKCPNSEIIRIRDEIATSTKDIHAKRLAQHAFRVIDEKSVSGEIEVFPSFPIGQQRSVKGDR